MFVQRVQLLHHQSEAMCVSLVAPNLGVDDMVAESQETLNPRQLWYG